MYQTTQGSWRPSSLSYGIAHTQLWHRSHSLPLSLSLCIHSSRITLTSAQLFYNSKNKLLHNVCPRCIYTYTQYWAIYKYSPQWYMNFVCRYSHESALTDSTIVRITSDLINWPRLNRTIGLIF